MLNTSVSFFSLCIFAILSIIALNFPKSKIQRNLFQNKIGNVLYIFTFIVFVLLIWKFNAFCITLFFYGGNCYSDFGTSFYNFYSSVFGTLAMAGKVL